ncbi:hypothetical protein SlGVgp089 [Spodoptera litura granulovirus]|uniref:Uncharacterized protein n=1 Tax=Spodoptera litura granulovirus TaxID=359919 RepID=A5IZU1_9BBAC|nr:hypothetical protein SlGVgp089 [Spodoptera litura granulovirus]ABQ52032.1 hypothetical protein SlGVgp089 [Spodoptera litura granulovirus]
MPIVYFESDVPTHILCYGHNHCYIKINNLLPILGLQRKQLVKAIPQKYLLNFATLQKLYNDKTNTYYPTTLFVKLEGLQFVNGKNKYYKHVLEKLQELNLSIETPLSDGCDYFFGVVQPNIEVFKFNSKFYYKACDVAKAANASLSYIVNKYVDDENVVVWEDLKNYAEEKLQKRIPNKWKNNTLLLKQAGIKQFLLRRQKQELYNGIIAQTECEDSSCYIKHSSSRYKRKVLYATNCLVAKLHNSIDFIILPNNVAYFKLKKFLKYYKLKIDMAKYENDVTNWKSVYNSLIQHGYECNIKWKPDTIMINDTGVYNIMMDNKLNKEAEDVYFKTLYKIKQ